MNESRAKNASINGRKTRGRRMFERPSGGACRLRRRAGRGGHGRKKSVEKAHLVSGSGTIGVAVANPTAEENVFEVEIPPEACPGKPIALFVEGARVCITCPSDAKPGQVICFRLAPTNGRDEEAATATSSTTVTSTISTTLTRASRRIMRNRRRESRSTTTTGSTASTGSSCLSSSMGRDEKLSSISTNKRLSFFQVARMGYRELVHAIIRPPRADYKLEALGPVEFFFCGRRFRRHDFTLQNFRGQKLQCSHWRPVELSLHTGRSNTTNDRSPVVIYMHGNASARVEVVPQALSYLLSLGGGVSVVAFDFGGSGHSDGDYVSLGYHERDDLQCVIEHLRSSNAVSTIALWGRSMGAATALMHADRDPTIAGMVLDSPFCDLTQLAMEMAQRGRDMGLSVPPLVVALVLRLVRASVRKRAKFDVKAISPLQHADKSFIPALFVAGDRDTFIDKSHSEALYERYAGDKNIIIVTGGDHNSPRPSYMLDSVSIFLQTCLQIPTAGTLEVPPGANLMAPPWLTTSYSSFAPEWLDDDDHHHHHLICEESEEEMHGSSASAAAFAPPEQAPPPPPRSRSSTNTEITIPCSRQASQESNPSTDGNTPGVDAMGGVVHGDPPPPPPRASSQQSLGFTPERQWQVQASFFRIFGGGQEPQPQPQPPEETSSPRSNGVLPQRRPSVLVHTLD